MIMLIFEDLLARHPGVVFGRGQVYNGVWERSVPRTASL